LNRAQPLTLACPGCGSNEVFYSCEPKCCFNHVCGECRTTFQPVTRKLGGKRGDITPPDPLPDSTEPTVACAACESIAVYVLEDGLLVCADCGALLALELTEVAPG